MSKDLFQKKRSLYRRFAVAYISCLCLPLLVLAFSLAQGGGWKPVLTGSAIYITFLVGITYQFIKELRELKREEDESKASLNRDEQ